MLELGPETDEERRMKAIVTKQMDGRAQEIEVSKPDWKRWSLSFQEAVDFVRYDLVEPPEPGRRGKLVIAVRRADR